MNVVMDIDGVLADFEGKFCASHQYYGKRHLIKLEDRMPWRAERITKWIANPRVYKDLYPIPLGLKIAKFISDQEHDVCLVSSRPDNMFDLTVHWLRRYNVPFASLSVGAGDKSDAIKNLRPILVIDDIPDILEVSRSLGVFSAIFDQFWNKNCDFNRICTMFDFELIWNHVMTRSQLWNAQSVAQKK